MMSLAEELSDCCNSVIYFIIALKGTGEEPESLRWMDFSFSNLIVCFVSFYFIFLCIYTFVFEPQSFFLDWEKVLNSGKLKTYITPWSIV